MASRAKHTGKVYLHFPCFDGVVSAALASLYLENEEGWSIEDYVPVNYEIQNTWASQQLARYSAVVDFLYHPSARFWADHHVTGIDADVLDDVSEDPSRTILFDPRSSSCAQVIWSALHQRTSSMDHLEDTVRWADKIDSASYDSPAEAILGESPASDINLTLIENATAQYCNELVRLIRRHPLDQVAKSRVIARKASSMRKRIRKGLKEVARNVEIRGDIAIMKVTETGDAIISRYSPYYFAPAARYSVSLVTSKRFAKITAMRNPWIHFESIPLGRLFSEYGGGGHQRVASVLVTDLSAADREALVDQISNRIHQLDLEQFAKAITA